MLFCLGRAGLLVARLLTCGWRSASPLNGQAAELWDKDPVEYKRLVLGRHQDLDDE